jgi:hypothetical protein
MFRFLILILSFSLLILNSYSREFPAVLNRQQTLITYNNGELSHREFFEIQINSRAGEKYTEISIPFSKMIKVGSIEGQITDCSGKILKKLSKADIKERSNVSEISLYEDHFIKEFTLKHNVYPYRIVYSYEYSMREFVNIADWNPVLNDDVPTLMAALQIEIPKTFQIAYRQRNLKDCKIDTLENTYVYFWQASYSGTLEKEVFAPPTYMYQPYVSVMPLSFVYDKKGSAESWQSFGTWQHELNLGLNDLAGSEKLKFRQMTAGLINPRDKARILYNHLQDMTRYINISIRSGGLKPYPASYVSERRYGDCKALSIYFKSLLEAAGIPSYYCKVAAGEDFEPLMTDFPSQQFNHIILCVPFEPDTLWVDCTSKEAFGFAGSFIQNREVLVINDDRSYLTRIPQLSCDQLLNTRNFQIQQKEPSDYTNVSFNYKCRGNEYSEWLNAHKSLPANAFDTYLRKKFSHNHLSVDSYEIRQQSRDSSFINLNGNATTSELYKYYGNDIVVQMIPFEIPELKKEVRRNLPIQLNYAINKIDTLNYILPEYAKIGFQTEPVELETEFGKYLLNYTLTENNLQVIKQLIIKSGNYPIGKYPAFFDFISKLSAIESSAIIVLQKS